MALNPIESIPFLDPNGSPFVPVYLKVPDFEAVAGAGERDSG